MRGLECKAMLKNVENNLHCFVNKPEFHEVVTEKESGLCSFLLHRFPPLPLTSFSVPSSFCISPFLLHLLLQLSLDSLALPVFGQHSTIILLHLFL